MGSQLLAKALTSRKYGRYFTMVCCWLIFDGSFFVLFGAIISSPFVC